MLVVDEKQMSGNGVRVVVMMRGVAVARQQEGLNRQWGSGARRSGTGTR